MKLLNYINQEMIIHLVICRQQEQGEGGIFGIPPWPKFIENTPPGDLGSSLFLNERKTLKFTLIQLGLGLIKLN